MQLKIHKMPYDAAMILQNHCGNRVDCDGCDFHTGETDGHDSCILRQMPEDWADFDIALVSEAKGGK